MENSFPRTKYERNLYWVWGGFLWSEIFDRIGSSEVVNICRKEKHLRKKARRKAVFLISILINKNKSRLMKAGFLWCRGPGSNWRRKDFQSFALPLSYLGGFLLLEGIKERWVYQGAAENAGAILYEKADVRSFGL